MEEQIKLQLVLLWTRECLEEQATTQEHTTAVTTGYTSCGGFVMQLEPFELVLGTHDPSVHEWLFHCSGLVFGRSLIL